MPLFHEIFVLFVTLCSARTVMSTLRAHAESRDVTNTLTSCNFTFIPETMDILEEKTSQSLAFNMTCDWSEASDILYITLQLWVINPKFVEISDNPHYNLSREHDATLTSNVTLAGREFGRTDVVFEVCAGPLPYPADRPGADRPPTPGPCQRVPYNVAVVPHGSVLSLVFVVILGVMIVVYNLGFGCAIRPEHVLDILKRPVGPVIGMCCQFLLMAPLSFGIAKMLRMDNVSGLGLLAVGSAPGGGGSNVFTYLLDGDLELSITMSFISTLVSLGMTPLWIWALGRYFTDGGTRTVIPVQNVFTSLAVVTIPVACGALIARFKPKAAKKIAWCLKPFTGVIGVVFISLGIYVNLPALLRVDWRTLVGALLVPLLGYSIGAAMARAFRQSRAKIITISLETGFQNFSLSLMILSSSLNSPEAQIASVVPICYTFLSAAMPALAFIAKQIIRLHRWRMRKIGHAGSADITTDPAVNDLGTQTAPGFKERNEGEDLVLNGKVSPRDGETLALSRTVTPSDGFSGDKTNNTTSVFQIENRPRGEAEYYPITFESNVASQRQC